MSIETSPTRRCSGREKTAPQSLNVVPRAKIMLRGMIRQWLVVTFGISCVVIAGLVLLRGCESKETKEARAYLNQGFNHYAAGRYEDAVISCKKTIVLRPDFDWAHYLVGWAYDNMASKYCKLKQYGKAVAVYEEYIAFKPDNSMAYYFMGNVYRDWKKYPEAVAAFKKCIAIKPTGNWAAEARKRLSELSRTQPANK